MSLYHRTLVREGYHPNYEHFKHNDYKSAVFTTMIDGFLHCALKGQSILAQGIALVIRYINDITLQGRHRK